MPQQLSFDLPVREARERDDFVVSPANSMAVAMIDRTDTWPNGKLVLTGPPGAGKTHLVHLWAGATNARILPAASLAGQDLLDLSVYPLAIEDVPDIAGNSILEETLFHLHNLASEGNTPLLLTGRDAPRDWSLTLSDLQSRMTGATHVALEPPDDALLGAVLAKLFADRQIAPPSNLIPYLLPRMERTFAEAKSLVERLDRLSLAQSRPITRDLARHCLGADEATK